MMMPPIVRNLIKRATVSLVGSDTGKYSSAQCKWGSDKVRDVQVISPYGYYYCAPVGSLALMFNVFGHEDNIAAIIDNPPTREKRLKPGEVCVVNPLTKSKIKFLENGDIEITGKNNLNVMVTGDINLTVNGNINATVGGTLTANVTGNTDITSPIITMHGELRATGEVTAFYGTVNALTFTNLVTKYNAHTHTSATAGNPTSATLAPNRLP